ncbi:MAG: hypothetical protein ABIZ05_15505 [Pseudonocardiaceae bacterium]
MVFAFSPLARSWVRLTAPCWRRISRSMSISKAMVTTLAVTTDSSRDLTAAKRSSAVWM